MSNKEISELKKKINDYNMQIGAIVPLLSENKPILNKKFNELLIQKAVLKSELKNKQTTIIEKIIKRIKIRKSEMRICDFF